MRKTKRRRNRRKTKKRSTVGGAGNEGPFDPYAAPFDPYARGAEQAPQRVLAHVPRPISIKSEKEIDIIFVRHGISCANVRKLVDPRIYKTQHFSLKDPSLTPNGINDAIEKGKRLYAQLNTDFGKQIPIVCASTLLRAQLTAYLMMQPQSEQPKNGMKRTLSQKIMDPTIPQVINVIPYISETGLIRTADNIPRTYDAQKELLDDTPIIRRSFVPGTYQDNKPDIEKFCDFLEFNIDTLVQKNIADRMNKFIPPSNMNTIIRPSNNLEKRIKPLLVIFTHGHLIEKILKETGLTTDAVIAALKDKGVENVENMDNARPNYSAWRFTFSRDTKKLSHVDNAVYVYDTDVYKQINKDKECSTKNISEICGTNLCKTDENVEVNDRLLARTLGTIIPKAARPF